MKKHIISLFAILILLFSCKPKNPIVLIKTELGEIEVEIYQDKAPITASHFLKNTDEEIYNNACFYRVVRLDNQPENDIKIEVIQAGLFHDSIVDRMPTIKHETTQQTGILHKNGVISMARLEPGTACTEFFICIGDQPDLDFGGNRNTDKQGFAAFGKVIKGMNLVKEIQNREAQKQILKKHIKIESVVRK
jgi:peptidyl-prolyl cis-trans isomerase A (cyclophilin A)